MSKMKKPIPRINQVFAKLVNDRGKQVDAAKELDTSSQSIGYYMKTRKIPADVIAKVEQLWGVNLITAAKEGNDIETIVSRETKQDATPRQKFDDEVEREVTKRELFDRLYKDLDNQARHLDKALDLVARLLPPGNSVESVTSKNR